MTDTTSSEVLPVGGSGATSTGWWGMMCLIASEGILFVYLIFSYLYLGSQQQGPWPPQGPPQLRLALPNTFVLLASSLCLWWGLRRFRRTGRRLTLVLSLAATLALGAAFVVVQGFEWASMSERPWTSTYGSAFFIVTGFHMAHVVAGLLILLMLLVWTVMGRFSQAQHEHLHLGGLYWHFVDVVWLAVFATLYLAPQFR